MKHHHTFNIAAPLASEVLLVGDFTDWQHGAIPMHKDETGIWTVSAELPPGSHIYLFIVDGKCLDPKCLMRTSGGMVESNWYAG